MELEFQSPDSVSQFYRELRCSACHRLICYEYIFEGRIKFICPRCKEVNVFQFKHRKSAKNDTVDLGDQDFINNA